MPRHHGRLFELRGGTGYAHGALTDGPQLMADRRRDPSPAPGDRLALAFDPTDLRLFDASGFCRMSIST